MKTSRKKRNKQGKHSINIDRNSLDLLVLSKRKQTMTRIKYFFKNKDLKKVLKKALLLMAFFFMCYIFMQLLNGDNIKFADICIADWAQKKQIIGEMWKSFFWFDKIKWNILIFVFIYWILYGITSRTKLSCIIIAIFTYGFGYINYAVTQIRGVAVSISDIYSIGTAATLVKDMELELDGNFLLATILFVITLFVLIFFVHTDDTKMRKNVKNKLKMIALGIIGMVIVMSNAEVMNKVVLWNLEIAYQRSGTNVTLVRMLKDLKLKKPQNYSKKEAESILSKYIDDTKNYDEGTELPNVIVVMNESFEDVKEVYNVENMEDNIPFFHELKNRENTVSGVMHSSGFGGSTANIEYELLTENMTGFLPKGALPYQQYIHKSVDQSMVAYMNNLGYQTNGMHAWYKNGYNRYKVYKMLGFNKSMFFEDIHNMIPAQNLYPSDFSAYYNWYEEMDAKPETEKSFSFILTMQNHIPYICVDENKATYDENEELNSYLQVENSSDEDLKELINYIDKYDEDIILLFFGDHQANIEKLEEYGYNGKYSDDESKYIVPFIIYANFDIEEKRDIETSTNYCQNLLYDAAEMPKDSYTKYVEDIREEIPVITANYYKDYKGQTYKLNDTSSPYFNKIREYWRLSYYQMIDR